MLDSNEIGIIAGGLASKVDMIAVAISLVAINTYALGNKIGSPGVSVTACRAACSSGRRSPSTLPGAARA